MELICYPLLSTRSRRAIKREYKSFGIPYQYNPRGTLVERLADDLGWTKQQVYEQLRKERNFLITYRKYY